jgi:hypothetical protein
MHHGDKIAEMTVLWQTCARLQRLGYTLSVLDVTAEESSETPGLQDMLLPVPRPMAAESATMSVVAAARGMRHLASTLAPEASLAHALGSLFQDFGALVIYADAFTLAEVMGLGDCYPVVAVSSETPSVLSAYAGLKILTTHSSHRDAALVTLSTDSSPRQLNQRIAKSLQNCTMNHLKCRLQHYDVSNSSETDNPSDDMRQLVLKLLDTASRAKGVSTPHRLWSH